MSATKVYDICVYLKGNLVQRGSKYMRFDDLLVTDVVACQIKTASEGKRVVVYGTAQGRTICVPEDNILYTIQEPERDYVKPASEGQPEQSEFQQHA